MKKAPTDRDRFLALPRLELEVAAVGKRSGFASLRLVRLGKASDEQVYRDTPVMMVAESLSDLPAQYLSQVPSDDNMSPLHTTSSLTGSNAPYLYSF